MFTIIGWIIFGFIVGSIATAMHPGDEKLGCWQTIALGIAGSFLGGAINYLIYIGSGVGTSHYLINSSGLIMSILGAIIVCYFWSKQNQ